MKTPNRATMRLMIMVYVGASLAMALPRLWAARHSTHDGVDGLVGDAINVAI